MIDVKVDDGVLPTLASGLRRSASGITQTLDIYDSDINTMKDRWTGEAATSAVASQQRWRSDMSERADQLNKLADAIDEIDGIYQKAEDQAAAFWPF
jgi:WXG100 family type VII secretion target